MSFEKALVLQCAPTLASLKTGNLFSIDYSSMKDLERDISLWSSYLESKGIKIFILKYTKSIALIYVYRESALKKDMNRSDISDYLMNYGYNIKNINQILKKLQNRLMTSEDFPHEIGLFLSYPLEDVTGFICNKGKNCTHCGYWKVYGNKEESVKKFQRYDKCRDIYLKLWSNGRSVLQLTVAV